MVFVSEPRTELFDLLVEDGPDTLRELLHIEGFLDKSIGSSFQNLGGFAIKAISARDEDLDLRRDLL